jgi:hypothetical protein
MAQSPGQAPRKRRTFLSSGGTAGQQLADSRTSIARKMNNQRPFAFEGRHFRKSLSEVKGNAYPHRNDQKANRR